MGVVSSEKHQLWGRMNEIEFKTHWNYRKEQIKLLPKQQQVLFAVDCALLLLHIWQKVFPDDECFKHAIDLALNSVLKEGSVTEKELRDAASSVYLTAAYNAHNVAAQAAIHAVSHAVWSAANAVAITSASTIPAANAASAANAFDWESIKLDWKSVVELYYQAYQPFDSQYKTPDTQGIVQEILKGNFDLMPILADALLDLGCPEDQANLTRNSKAYSNWALFNLRNTEPSVA